MRIRGVVLEETRGKFSVKELDLADPAEAAALVERRDLLQSPFYSGE